MEQKKRSPKTTILLSVNAAAILIAGILVSSAIWLNGGLTFRAVGERSDIVEGTMDETLLLDSVSDSNASVSEYTDIIGNDDYVSTTSHEFYRQSEATHVDNDATCRYPVIKGTGTTTITAGTYDGLRKDSIDITVLEPPIDQWEHEVLTLVNKIRVKNNLNQLMWGETCENAAEVRAKETITLYAHTRPDGSSWATACKTPDTGGVSGENLAVGNAAVSPATVVSLWMGSETHRANILNPDYTKLAVGFVFDLNTDYKTYWSQFFSTY